MYRFLNFRYFFVNNFTEFIDFFLSTKSCQGLWFVLISKTKTFTSCIEQLLKIWGWGGYETLKLPSYNLIKLPWRTFTINFKHLAEGMCKNWNWYIKWSKTGFPKKLIYFRLLGIFSETLMQHRKKLFCVLLFYWF